MAKNPQKKAAPTKKHQARLARERQQTRWIVIGTIIVVVLVVGLILGGIINSRWIEPNRTAASVDGDKISVKEFQNFARFIRSTLVDNAIQTYQFMQLFEDNPESMSSFVQQLQQIQVQLEQNISTQDAIDQLIRNRVIEREAAERDITVSEEEVRLEFQNLLGYYPDGTPVPTATAVPVPTSTFTPLQLTAVAPFPTPTLTSSDPESSSETLETEEATSDETEENTDETGSTQTPEPSPTETLEPTAMPEASEELEPTITLEPTLTLPPTPSPTAYTEAGYQEQYDGVVGKYKEYGVSENLLIYVIRMQLLTEKLRVSYLEENPVPNTREEVWARHILVADVETADEVLEKLDAGEHWCNLAMQYSTDTSNNQNCGDLGWFGRGQMVEPFENTAFSIEIGEISEPVETTFGQHLIWKIGHEDKIVSGFEYESLQDNAFNDWLDTLVAEAEVEIAEFLNDIAPDEPGFPVELQQFIQQYLQTFGP